MGRVNFTSLEEESYRKQQTKNLILFLIYFPFAIFALLLFVNWPGIDKWERARFGDMIYGRAFRPYVTRVLMPWLVRGITYITPSKLKTTISEFIRREFADFGQFEFLWVYPYEFAVTFLLLLLSLLGFAFSLRRLAAVTLGLKGWRLNILPIAAFLLLPGMYCYVSYIYDFPTLFLFTLGLLLIAEQRWKLLSVVFPLATLSKETSILLTLVWVLTGWKVLPHRKFFLGLILQIIGFIIIRGIIGLIYQDNPGPPFDWHMDRNISWLSNPANYLVFLHDPFYFSVPFACFYPRLLGIVYLIAVPLILLGRRHAPPFLKKSFLIIIPLVTLSFFLGFIDELRGYYEFYPIAFLTLAHETYSLLLQKGKTGKRQKQKLFSGNI